MVKVSSNLSVLSIVKTLVKF